jgi:translation initiation factor 2B subunit (eIF-2B alpha/beta/delta family)
MSVSSLTSKKRQYEGSYTIAKETADILRNLIGGLKFSTLQELLNAVTEVGKRLANANPLGM